MPYQVTPLSDEPIITVTMSNPFDFMDGLRPMIEAIGKASEAYPGRYFVIYEFPNLTVTFSDMVITLAELSNKIPGSVGDPRVTALCIAPPEMMQFAVQSLEQTQYGKIHMEIMPTMEEALDYARLMLSLMP